MGETADELRGAIADLRDVGVDILTLGQYLRPSRQHLPVARWWTPDEFAELGAYAEGLGFAPRRVGPARALELPRQARPRRPTPASPRADAGVTVVRRAARAPGARPRDAASSASTSCCCRSGADLPYLTGLRGDAARAAHDARAARRRRRACSSCPRLEAPRVVEQPDVFEIVPWDETDDPIALVAGLVGVAPRTAAIGDHTWARFVLDLQRALPDVAFRRATDVTGPMRIVKDAGRDRRAARRRARRSTTIARGDARPPVRRVAPSSTCTASSSSACSRPVTSGRTSPSSPPAPTPPARTTTRATG